MTSVRQEPTTRRAVPSIQDTAAPRHSVTIVPVCDDLAGLRSAASSSAYRIPENNVNGLVLCTEECNLRCAYCFERGMRVDTHKPIDQVRGEFEAFVQTHLECFVEQLTEVNEAQGRRGSITFHGGEPLLVGAPLLRSALEVVSRYPQLEIGLQTNATLVSDEFIDLFVDYGVKVGVSLDGPRHIHDAYRTRTGGSGSWEATFGAVEAMRRKGVSVGALATVTDVTMAHQREFYEFFRDNNLFFSFNPCFDDPNAPGGVGALDPTAYHGFTRKMFDMWIEDESSDLSISCFERIMSAMSVKNTVYMEVCTYIPDCSHTTVAIDTSGDFYRCLHYCMDKTNRIGHLSDQTLSTAVGDASFEKRPDVLRESACKDCDVFEFCYGGCPYVAEAHGGSIMCRSNTCAGQRDIVHHIRSYLEQFERGC